MKEQYPRSTEASPTKSWMRRGGGCFVILLAALFIYYGLYFILRGPLSPDPQHIAHRGGPVYAPENTMAAFRHAIEAGVDWLEFDVQRTRDGVLVVIHDETVDRTTDGTGKVADLTWDQIQELDAGKGEGVPTFEQVIHLAKQEGVGLMPEAKSPYLYPKIEMEIAAALEAEDYVDTTVLQSFEPEALVSVRQMIPGLPVCPLFGLWQFDLGDPQPSDAEFVCPMAEMVLLNPWMIRQAHQDGREVYVWFGIIERPLVMRILLAMGADGLIVDDPIALAKILEP
jgi:glycerophosphoryl diester phosphodiesterase